MLDPKSETVFQAFLLRTWHESGQRRFRLQDVQTGASFGFTDLAAMLEFLNEAFAAADDDPKKRIDPK